MNRDMIREQVLTLFYRLFPEKKFLTIEGLFDTPLLCGKIRLKARDLLCLFLDTEKEFNIHIPEQAIIEGRFSTINSITDIILECRQES